MSPSLPQLRALTETWASFCDSLKEQGQALLDGSRGETSDQEFAEGIRHLGRLAVHALQSRVEFCDTDFPGFYRVCDDRNRWGAPNADTLYLMAPYRGNAVYRITGNCFGRRFAIGRLWSDSYGFEWSADGSFEVKLAAEPHPGNWIAIPPDADGAAGVTGRHPGLGGWILVKIFDEDWSAELPAARIAIERIDGGRLDHPGSMCAESLSRRIADAENLVRECWNFYDHHQAVMRSMGRVNELTAPVPAIIPALKPDVDASPMLYGFGHFEISPDEGWLVQCPVPAVGHWSFQLYSRWYESLEFKHRQSSINRSIARIDADGWFRAVVSAVDPGIKNWLDTEGHLRGWLIYRWLGCETAPAANARVVKVRDLPNLLPATHFQGVPAARAADRRQRAKHFSHLYQT